MRNELVVKSRGLKGTSDLTLLAPIKPGLVPSLEVVTYKTRVKRLMKTLNMGRSSSHEYALLRPVSDAVERVRVIHSFRVMVLEPENKILLAVTFDGTWESYIRILWQKVGTLLDVIFCNSDGYVSALDNGFEAWCGWVRSVQVETEFFFSTPGLTVDDFYYLREAENLHRRCPVDKKENTDLAAARLAWGSVEQVAWDTARHLSPLALAETARQGFQALSVLHRLTYMYVPGTDEGKYLQRAAREILMEFVRLAEDTSVFQFFVEAGQARFGEQIAWLLGTREQRNTPALPDEAPPYPAKDVQGGIIHSYADATHGCLLLLGFDNAAAAAALLQALRVDSDETVSARQRPVLNIAFTYEGLRLLGLSEAELALFPQEFREGMEARAGMLGDFRGNHPRRWRLPRRHGEGPNGALVELSAVHAVLQLRGHSERTDLPDDVFAAEHPLCALATEFGKDRPGVRLLAVQPLQRHLDASRRVIEHFGFVDGDNSKTPPIDPAVRGELYEGQMRLGEILCGHDNEGDFAKDLDPAPLAWLKNCSFLVVRKLRQDVAALNAAVDSAAASTKLPPETILAKMMGRKRTGEPLVAPGRPVDFDYSDDPQGRRCPFQAHIRRANPRTTPDTELPLSRGGRAPRILRRGMAYGPRAADGITQHDDVERGLVFMAYNARISEQFEVIQRWLSGGNSSGIFSGASDPLLGVPEDGQQRLFRFEAKGQVHRIALDGNPTPMEDPQPFVRLEWGMYLFVPSLSVLAKLRLRALLARPAAVWSAADGERRVQALLALQAQQGDDAAALAWKTTLEDHEAQEKFVSAGVWAALREQHGGVLRTPYGVLVAGHEQVMQALADPEGRLSVSGYHARLLPSIGEIYLGLDRPAAAAPGQCPYDHQSMAINKAITDLGKAQAFTDAYELTSTCVLRFIAAEVFLAEQTNQPRWELNLNVKEIVDDLLAGLCERWFGMEPDHPRLQRGGARWDWALGQPATYPGHFTAPSRYVFQPQPEKLVRQYGETWGRALTDAMRLFVDDHRTNGRLPQHQGKPAPLAGAIFAAFPGREHDDLVARTMVGAMMGFLPTLDGNLKLSLNEWLRDGTFWALRQALRDRPGPTTLARATELLEPPLKQAMQLRPSPELIWRTAVAEHRIGDVTVRAGDKVVLALVSATQQSLAAGDDDVYPVFGGRRHNPDAPAPTHACPGYDAAMGVLLGTFSALLDVKADMRPSPAPLAFTLEGHNDNTQELPRALPAPAGELEHSAGWLLADGDSWFDYWGREGRENRLNLLRALRRFHHWGVDELADTGDTLAQIAGAAQLQKFSQRLARMKALGRPPKALLLSGGGNDVVGKSLPPLLNRFAPNTPVLSAAGLETIHKTLRGHLVKVLSHYMAASRQLFDEPLPIVLHGYDYPVPDGRGPFGVVTAKMSWLLPGLHYMGYTNPVDARAAMKLLIKELNKMQRAVAESPPFKGHVHHVNLCGTLVSADHKHDWENELHPTEAGFRRLADAIAGRLAVVTAPAAAPPPAAGASASPSK